MPDLALAKRAPARPPSGASIVPTAKTRAQEIPLSAFKGVDRQKVVAKLGGQNDDLVRSIRGSRRLDVWGALVDPAHVQRLHSRAKKPRVLTLRFGRAHTQRVVRVSSSRGLAVVEGFVITRHE